MGAPARLAGFAAILLVAFLAAFGVGAAVGDGGPGDGTPTDHPAAPSEGADHTDDEHDEG